MILLQEFILGSAGAHADDVHQLLADLGKLQPSVGCSGRKRQIWAHPDLVVDQRQVLTLVPAVPSTPVLACGN